MSLSYLRLCKPAHLRPSLHNKSYFYSRTQLGIYHSQLTTCAPFKKFHIQSSLQQGIKNDGFFNQNGLNQQPRQLKTDSPFDTETESHYSSPSNANISSGVGFSKSAGAAHSSGSPSPQNQLFVDINTEAENLLRGLEDREIVVNRTSEDDLAHLPAAEREKAELINRQLEFEEEAVNNSIKRYLKAKEEITKMGKGACLAPAERVLVDWFTPLLESIKEEQRAIEEGTSTMESASVYGSFLTLLPAEKMTVITMHTILSLLLSEPNLATFTRCVFEVAEACQAELSLHLLKKGGQTAYYKYLTEGIVSVKKINYKTKMMMDNNWSNKVIGYLGSTLIAKLLDTALINGQPAFTHEMVTNSEGKTVGMIRAHESVFKLIEEGHELRKTTHARYFPMIVPPKDWSSPLHGGYLSVVSSVIRHKGYKKQLNELIRVEKQDPNKMKLIYRSLNALSKTPWKINKDIYAVIKEAWDKGGGIADLPSRQDLLLPVKPLDADPATMNAWKRQYKKVEQQNYDLHSLRCDTSYKLRVAEEFKDEVLYFPHNMDFRGRTYPIPPHLNHLGADMSRSLLVFHEGKPLGKGGLEWLKVHLCNLYGLDKIPFDQRVKFIEENLDNVFDSADHPLEGKKWWLKADYPWQCLATCIELTKALRSPDPEAYVSHQPVHQDGTCNGLQHYAALGGDLLGGKHVNLLPSERPQDVYSGVADIVRKRVREDAAKGDPLAIALQDKIERKVVKQTVMTSVYGVTFVGASRQIANQLKDLKIFEDDVLYKASAYLAHHTFASLGEIFLGARTIMDWLAACARTIASETQQEVSWVTPLGLTVIQPYKRSDASGEFVRTVVQTICLKPREGLKVSVTRQKSAFPPNYIHSLDSTHMMLTAIKMEELGLTFASVHDSYWTHACTVPEMSKVLREKFIELHQQPLLENLLEYFHQTYPNVNLPPLPKRGDLDLAKVAESDYFFH